MSPLLAGVVGAVIGTVIGIIGALWAASRSVESRVEERIQDYNAWGKIAEQQRPLYTSADARARLYGAMPPALTSALLYREAAASCALDHDPEYGTQCAPMSEEDFQKQEESEL